MQTVRFQSIARTSTVRSRCWRRAADHPDPRYAEEAARIRSWLTHLDSREAYIWRSGRSVPSAALAHRAQAARETPPHLLGRKTRKMIERRGRDPEFQALEREVTAVRPARVLDAGCGEGGVAMAIAARHPGARRGGRGGRRDQRGDRPAPEPLLQRGVSRGAGRGSPRGLPARLLRPRLLVRGARARARRGGDDRLDPHRAAAGRALLLRGADARVPRPRPAPGLRPDSRLRGSLSRLLGAGLKERFGREKDFRLAKIPGAGSPASCPTRWSRSSSARSSSATPSPDRAPPLRRASPTLRRRNTGGTRRRPGR